jgi:DNA polymerase I-like protein with 3'-5' exonuclease and polymerase domains
MGAFVIPDGFDKGNRLDQITYLLDQHAKIHPCYGPKDKCTNPGKQPRWPVEERLNAPRLKILNHFKTHPNDNVGLVPVDGHIAFDPDLAKEFKERGDLGPLDAWKLLCAWFFEFLHALTDRGFHHHAFCPDVPANQGKISVPNYLPGIHLEVLVGPVCNVIIPPSIHPSGHVYCWCAHQEAQLGSFAQTLEQFRINGTQPREKQSRHDDGTWKTAFKGDLRTLAIDELCRTLDLYGEALENKDSEAFTLRCPWGSEHGDPERERNWSPSDTGTVIFWGNGQIPIFKCLHENTCSEHAIREFLLWCEEQEPGIVDRHCRRTYHSFGFGDSAVDEALEESEEPAEYTRKPWPPSTAKPEDFEQKIFYPHNSILQPFMEYGRSQTEGSDAYLIGSILPVCSALIARRVWVDFGGPLYLNLFNLVVGKPGDRKSFTIKIAKRIAQIILPSESFLPTQLSVEGLFNEYNEEDGGCPDKICIVDDAALVLSTWRTSCYGERVADQMLSLYDCEGFSEAYRRNKKEAAKTVRRRIQETSTALIFGATFADALFSKQHSQQGLARRFNYYLSCEPERFIEWPESKAVLPVADLFKPLLAFEGRLSRAPETKEIWRTFQLGNRARIAEVPENRPDLAHALAGEPTHVLKIAALFELTIAVAKGVRAIQTIGLDALQLAIAHVAENLRAADYLFRRAKQLDAAQAGEEILAKIRTQFPASKRYPDTIFANRTQLTSKFCLHTARKGAMSTEELYLQILPELIRQGQAQLTLKRGKFELYAFRRFDDDDPDTIGPETGSDSPPPDPSTVVGTDFENSANSAPSEQNDGSSDLDAPRDDAGANSPVSPIPPGVHTYNTLYAHNSSINTIIGSSTIKGSFIVNESRGGENGEKGENAVSLVSSTGGGVNSLHGTLALDFETYAEPKIGRKGRRITSTVDALDPFKGQIRLVTLADSAGTISQFDLRDTPKLPPEILEALGREELVIHNAAFELRFLATKFGLWPTRLFCTLTAFRLLEPLKTVPHGYGAVVERYLDVKLPKEHGSSDWGALILTECQKRYASDDVRYSRRLQGLLAGALAEEELTHVFELEMALLPIVTRMELQGFAIDVERLKAVLLEQQAKAEIKLAAVREAFGKPLNPNSSDQVLEAFKELGISLVKSNPDGSQQETTEEELLCTIDDSRAGLVLEYRKAVKLATALESVLKVVRSDGRIYAQFNPLGAMTGRFSSRRPNLQQVPKKGAKQVRSIFVAGGDDRCLIVADYSQIELRVAALVADETVMIEAFKNRIDLHSKIAAVSLRIPVAGVIPEQRDIGKTINFGFLYGRSAEGYRRGVRKDYGLVLTPAEAANYRNAFFATYPAIAAWHEECKRKANDPRNNRARTIFGRLLCAQIDDVWARFNLWTNYVVQGSCADLLKLAMLRVAAVLPSDCYLVATVHDELIYDVPADLADQFCAMIRMAMEAAFVEMFGSEVPIVVEAKVCANWGEK